MLIGIFFTSELLPLKKFKIFIIISAPASIEPFIFESFDHALSCKIIGRAGTNFNTLSLARAIKLNFNSVGDLDFFIINLKEEMLVCKKWIKYFSESYLGKFYEAYFDQKTAKNIPTYLKNTEKLYEYYLNNPESSNKNIKKFSNLLAFGKIIHNLIKFKDKELEVSTQIKKQCEEKLEHTSESPILNIVPQEPFIRSLSKEPKLSFKEIEKLIDAEDYETLVKHQKQLENYFKHKKEELQNQHMQELFNIKTPISWNTREGNFSSNSKNVVTINEEKKLYAVIDPKLEDKLGEITFSMFTKALEKGESTRNKGVDGIKYRDTLIILKVCDQNDRLYTNEIYSNNGNKLIVFNHLGNHDAVDRAASEYGMIEIPLIGE